MASVGHFPSAIEASLDGLICLHSGNPPRSTFPLLAFRPRRLNADVMLGSSKTLLQDEMRSLSLCCGIRKSPKWKSMRVYSSSNDPAGNDAGEESEDALQASVEKSKKVLAMQRNLLNQIAERKKLVSAIKSSILNEEGGDSILGLDIASTDGNGLNEVRGLDKASAKEPGKDFFSEDTSLNSNSLGQPDYSARDSESKTSSKKNYLGVNLDISLRDLNKNMDPAELEDNKSPSPEKVQLDDNDPVGRDVKEPPLVVADVMNVILVALECAPWIKTGGLGDVAGALPKALARRGHRLMVVLPRYGNYAEAQNTGIRKMYKVDGQDMEVNFFQAFIDGVDFVFVDSPIFRHIENNIYGGNRVDILKRMVLFCKAAVEVPWHVPCGGVCYGDGNLVFIANDWHTALLPVYLKAYYRDHGIMKYTRSVLVIHNIAHQGRGPVDDFAYVDLPNHYLDIFRMYDPLGGEHFNIFAAGLKMADRIVTVSHGYAWELKTPEGGWGLHGIINENEWKLRGIVNGIDTKDWNPMLDVHLQSDGYINYSLDTLQTGKARCKKALQKELGLPVRENVPVLGFIGRLDHQKGVDLIAEAIPWIMDQDVQLVMLGTGRADLEQMLRQFESQYHDRIRSWVGFSVKTAHRITAGADILLMPSRFEPCGLNQLYAMTYGTIPVVHAVGGLRDTVQPFNPYGETGLGWTFERAEVNQLIHALGNCLLTYREYKTSWEGIQRRGMMQDLSWDSAAQNYEEVLLAAKYQW